MTKCKCKYHLTQGSDSLTSVTHSPTHSAVKILISQYSIEVNGLPLLSAMHLIEIWEELDHFVPLKNVYCLCRLSTARDGNQDSFH